jgi:aspartyl-tRNA(Asn)/glutamyl-tRNA(Gln) amidotransferase subunit C
MCYLKALPYKRSKPAILYILSIELQETEHENQHRRSGVRGAPGQDRARARGGRKVHRPARPDQKFTGQLDQILQYFEKLNELDTKDVEPTRHAIAVVNAFRDDEVRESFGSETALKNAPDKEGPFFKVPKIIE